MITDPCLTKSSADVVNFLEGNNDIGFAFSVDVEDLFYAVPHSELFLAVKKCIDENGAVAFQNGAGMSVGNLLALLEFYLQSTYIKFDDKIYLQKKGICIGSCIAPVLCHIFLSTIDRSLHDRFNSSYIDKVLKVFHYVDDFLVLFNKCSSSYEHALKCVLEDFRNHGKGLTFTFERPDESKLQFLDLRLTFNERHVCWAYSPRAQKKAPSVQFSSLKNGKERHRNSLFRFSTSEVVHSQGAG